MTHASRTWFCNEMAIACKNVKSTEKYASVGFQMIGNSLILLFERPQKAFTDVEEFPPSSVPNQGIKVKNGKDVVYRKIIKPQWRKQIETGIKTVDMLDANVSLEFIIRQDQETTRHLTNLTVCMVVFPARTYDCPEF